MQQQSSVPAPPPTRALRGLALFRDHGAEIEPLGKGVYRVPGCSGGSYVVDLAVFGGTESCNCPDRAPVCIHIICATIYRAKARARSRREQHQRTASRASRASLAPLAASL
jgi:hypothetical protein